MTQEEIRETWEKAGRRFYAPKPEDFGDMYRHNKETALEKLAAKYRRFSRLGLLMAIASVFYMLPNHLFIEAGHLRIWVSLAFIAYFLTCSMIDHWLWKGIESIDCYRMTVKEVADKAMYYRRKHLLSMVFLFPCAVGVIGFMVYAMGFDEYLLFGVLAGALVGGAIGFRQYLEFMAEYRKLRD